MPAVREGGLPGRGIDAAVRANDEDVQFVPAAGDRGDGRPGSSPAAPEFPPPVPRAEPRFPGRCLNHAVDVCYEYVELVLAAGDHVDGCPLRNLDVAIRHHPCQPSANVGSQAAVYTCPSVPTTKTSSLSALRETAVTC